jgi:thiol peroxidase
MMSHRRPLNGKLGVLHFEKETIMASVLFKGTPTTTSGNLPAKGSKLPEFTVVNNALGETTLADFAGKKKILSIFPSLDTGTCATALRTFNQKAASLDNTVIINISKDLPFAQKRFCGAEGITNVETFSAFRSTFAKDYGLELEGSPLKGLCSRVIIVADENNTVLYTEQVPETTQEPNYEAALEALKVAA